MKALPKIIASFLALAISLSAWGFASAQTPDVQYFPETGHNIRGDFLRYYNSAPDPKLVFGFPVTEQFISRDGKTVQYFQRARFERSSDASGNPGIVLTPIGQALYKPGGQLDINNPLACEVFNTGYRVCFAFLDFFNSKGGIEQFGNPISPFEFHEGLIVQYFERARFEWRADKLRLQDQPVTITDLGRLYFDHLNEDRAHLKPVPPFDATINPVLSLRVRAFVTKSITGSSGSQIVFVIVQSQTQQAIPNATGTAAIQFPDGRLEKIGFTTNRLGVASFSFNFSDQERGKLVPIEIHITHQNLSATSITSFRIWY